MSGSKNHDNFTPDPSRSEHDRVYSSNFQPGRAPQTDSSAADRALDERLTTLISNLHASLGQAPVGLTGRVYAASLALLKSGRTAAAMQTELVDSCGEAVFEQWADAELDSRLSELLAADSDAPEGLIGRVFEASVQSLPKPVAAESARASLKLASHGPDRERVAIGREYATMHAQRRWHLSSMFGGRMALAASLSLVAILGIWMAQIPLQFHDVGSRGDRVASNDQNGNGQPPNGQLGVAGSPATSITDERSDIRHVSYERFVSEAEWQVFNEVDLGQNKVRYLLETSSLSMGDLSRDLENMAMNLTQITDDEQE